MGMLYFSRDYEHNHQATIEIKLEETRVETEASVFLQTLGPRFLKESKNSPSSENITLDY